MISTPDFDDGEELMSFLWRTLPILLSILTLSACSTTHPRKSPDLKELVATPKRIAILRPQIDAKVKYIDTPEFFTSPDYSANWEAMISTGIRHALESNQHKVYHSLEVAEVLPRGKKQAELLNNRLVDLTEKSVIVDPDYNKRTVPVYVTAKTIIPKQITEKFDYIIATKGRAKIETIREFYARWFRNIGFNLLTFPITAASAFIPVPIPLSVTISTSIFEPSPEDCFVSLVVIDCKSHRVIYQNDYFHKTIPSDDTELKELGEVLMGEFMRDAQDD